MVIKLRDVVVMVKNSRTQQISFCLKAKQLKKRKITPEELMEMTIPKIKTKFYKKINNSKITNI